MLDTLQAFLDRGGPVLFYIMILTFVMWVLILERLFYFRIAHKGVAEDALDEWRSRSDRSSTYASWVREKLLSEVRQKAQQNVSLAKTMVALAPLLGLLGTVTGMVSVFDIMAITDGADAKAMSAGVSKATIPTMAGMVASITGLPFTTNMDRAVDRAVARVADDMEMV